MFSSFSGGFEREREAADPTAIVGIQHTQCTSAPVRSALSNQNRHQDAKGQGQNEGRGWALSIFARSSTDAAAAHPCDLWVLTVKRENFGNVFSYPFHCPRFRIMCGWGNGGRLHAPFVLSGGEMPLPLPPPVCSPVFSLPPVARRTQKGLARSKTTYLLMTFCS